MDSPRFSLLTLPTEITDQICATFCGHCNPDIEIGQNDQHALKTLSLTCRRLRAIAQPMLYHEIRTGNNLAKLVRTIVSRPELGKFIRTLALLGDNYGFNYVYHTTEYIQFYEHHYNHEYEYDDDSPGYITEFKDAIELGAKRVGIRLTNDWDGDGALSGHLSDILLAHCPSLEALYCNKSDEWDAGSHLATSRITLPLLRYICVNSRYMYGDDQSIMDRDLLKAAPNLQILVAEMCRAVPPNLPLTNVKTVIFRECNVTAEHVDNVVTACPLLERFAYSTSEIGAMNNFSDPGISRASLLEALRPRRMTLRHLNLDFDTVLDGYYYHPGLGAPGCFGSFAEFDSLETLTVQPKHFCANPDEEEPGFYNSDKLASMLPVSLERLCLASGEDWPFSEPIGLIEAIRRGQFPKLKTVKLAVMMSEIGRVKELFASVGVKFRLYRRPYDFPYLDYSRLGEAYWLEKM